MTQITLNSKQINEFAAFIIKHNKDKFFVAKDEGAYVGCTHTNEDGTLERVLYFFKGMDPSKEKYDGEAYDNAHYAFGGDDFGEFLETKFIVEMSKKINPSVTIKITATQIKMDGKFKKEAPQPMKITETEAPKQASPSTKKVSKGVQIQQMLNAGCDIDTIVETVGTTKNSVRWYMSKMKKAA